MTVRVEDGDTVYDFEDEAAANQFFKASAPPVNQAPPQKKPQISAPKKDPGFLEKNEYFWPTARSFARGATAGISEPLSAGVGSLIAKGIQGEQKISPQTTGGVPEWLQQPAEKGIPEIYDEMSSRGSQELREMEKKHPYQTTIGNIAGLVSPGGVFSQGTKLAGKAAGAIPGLVSGASKVARYGIQSGLANTIYQGIDNASGKAMGENRKWSPGKDFAEGALYDVGLRSIGPLTEKVISPIASGAKSFVGDNLSRVSAMVKSLPGVKGLSQAADEIKANKFTRNLESIAQKVGADDRVTVGNNFKGAVAGEKKALSQSWDDLVTPVLKEHGGKKASVDGIQAEIKKAFQDYSLVDDAGNINLAPLEKLPPGDPTRKSLQQLAEYSETLANNPPTVSELNLIKRSLQGMADFGKMNKDPSAKMFSDIARSARKSLEDNIRTLSGEAGAEQFNRGMKEYATKAPQLQKLAKIASKEPEKIPSLVRRMEGTGISQAVDTVPGLKTPMQKVVVSQILQASNNPKKLSKVINQYGREQLKNILDQDTLKSLTKLGGMDPGVAKSITQWMGKKAQYAISAGGKAAAPYGGAVMSSMRNRKPVNLGEIEVNP